MSLVAVAQELAEDEWRDSFAVMASALKQQMALERSDPQDPSIRKAAHIKLDFDVLPITPADWLCFGNDVVSLLFVDLKAPTDAGHELKAARDKLRAIKQEK